MTRWSLAVSATAPTTLTSTDPRPDQIRSNQTKLDPTELNRTDRTRPDYTGSGRTSRGVGQCILPCPQP
ncbi:MAG: hypothetical protein J07HX5_01741 [halophilic archaeon J07HX5]|nr:MAG: hypothetical protein J07HX5_01741 [halophilic archaeon J07HX5]